MCAFTPKKMRGDDELHLNAFKRDRLRFVKKERKMARVSCRIKDYWSLRVKKERGECMHCCLLPVDENM